VQISRGVPVTMVAAQLGHSRNSTTLDTYSHVLIDDQEAICQDPFILTVLMMLSNSMTTMATMETAMIQTMIAGIVSPCRSVDSSVPVSAPQSAQVFDSAASG